MNEPGSRELDRAPEPGSVVPCPRKGGARIAVGRCVEWQRDDGCGCEYALVSLRATERHLRGRAVSERCDDAAEHERDRAEALASVLTLISRAEAMERAGPAVVAPASVPRATPALAVVPPPPKEQPMGPRSPLDAITDADFRAAYQKYGGSIDKVRQEFKSSWASVKRRVAALGMAGRGQPQRVEAPAGGIPSGSPRTVPRTVADVAARHTGSGDVVHLLERQLAHHQEQAGKIEKALAALR